MDCSKYGKKLVRDVELVVMPVQTTYHVRHMRALLEHGLGQTMKKKQLKDLVTKVEAMYLD